MKYDYETFNKDGEKVGFIIKGKQVVIYINDKECDIPQGGGSVRELLDDIKKSTISLEKGDD